jgi:hypothetical protein
MLTFSERTVSISIDTARCSECSTKACIAACQTYARGMLELRTGVPSVEHLDCEGIKHGGTECLACEYECLMRGRQAITIDVPIKGLVEYLERRRSPTRASEERERKP